MPRRPKKTDLASEFRELDMQRIPLARMKVSISNKSISKLEVPKPIADADPSTFSLDNLRDVYSSSKSRSSRKDEKMKKRSSSSSKKRSKEEMQVIDAIWKHLGSGSIDLTYAIVGYGFNGRPILDHDIFVNLLINYGFTIGPVLEFIDDFNAVSLEDNEFPIVMVNSHMEQIYKEVRPLSKEEEEAETKS
jgi:hypothetical protein